MTTPRPTLAVGVGNPTRQDDAAGPLLARKIQALGLQDVEVQVAHQLTPEMAADWARRKRVLVIDAAVTGPEVDLRELDATPSHAAVAASHTTDPPTLVALTAQLYGHRPELWLCTLRAESLDFTEQLTSPMLRRVETAKQRLIQWFLDFP